MDNKKRARNGSESEPSTTKRTRASSTAHEDDALAAKSQQSLQNSLFKATDDYVELASNIVLYEKNPLGPYGYDFANQSWPLQCVSTLQYIQSKSRRGSILERWSPLEIATFEAAMAVHGKVFEKVQKEVKTKTCQEIIDFYYVWKKTRHYARWKDEYVPPYLDHSDDEDEEDSTKSKRSNKVK